MKVHPVPTRKRNKIAIQCFDTNFNNYSRNPQNLSTGFHNKKLRRLPHIFARVLELPFRSDADVVVEESRDCFKFVAETDGMGEVRAHMVQIYPGVTKIVVRPKGFVELSSLDELELDMWRFRLPESTRPELASAVFEDGELIVTVPKGAGLGRDGGERGVGIGVVLMQEQCPVAFFNEKLNGTALWHLTYDNEFHTLVRALDTWHHYLWTKEFMIHIDHESMRHINSQGNLNK